jgi:hypothetical protein
VEEGFKFKLKVAFRFKVQNKGIIFPVWEAR